MSTLNVANITDGSTTVGTEYVVNGSAKAYLQYDQVPPSVIGSFNVSSVTDDGTGQYTTTFTNSMADATYVITWSGGRSIDGTSRILPADILSTGYERQTWDISSSAYTDTLNYDCAHGDLA